MNRIEWIDISRGLCVLLMLFAHISPLLVDLPPFLSMIFRLAPFAFFFLVGIGLRLSLDRKNRPAKYYLLRGVLLIVGGLGYNLLEYNLLAAGFFQLIGSSVIVTLLFERVTGGAPHLLLAFSVISIVISFAAQPIMGLAQPQNQLLDLLHRFLLLDYFSFFPWVSVVFLGLAFCFWDKGKRSAKTNAFLLSGAICSLTLAAGFRLLGTTMRFNPVSSSMFFVGISSLAFLVYASRSVLIKIPYLARCLLTLLGNHTIELLVVQWFFFRTLPEYFFPGQRLGNWLLELAYVFLAVPALIAVAFLFERIPNEIYRKMVTPLYITTIVLAILEVLHVVCFGFSIEVLILAFLSSMMMAFSLRGLQRLVLPNAP